MCAPRPLPDPAPWGPLCPAPALLRPTHHRLVFPGSLGRQSFRQGPRVKEGVPFLVLRCSEVSWHLRRQLGCLHAAPGRACQVLVCFQLPSLTSSSPTHLAGSLRCTPGSRAGAGPFKTAAGGASMDSAGFRPLPWPLCQCHFCLNAESWCAQCGIQEGLFSSWIDRVRVRQRRGASCEFPGVGHAPCMLRPTAGLPASWRDRPWT